MDREDVIQLLREVLTFETSTEYGYYSTDPSVVWLIIKVDGVEADRVRVTE